MTTAALTRANDVTRRLREDSDAFTQILSRAEKLFKQPAGPSRLVVGELARHEKEISKSLAKLEAALREGLSAMEASNDPAQASIDEQVRAMRAPRRWVPSESDLVRGRQALLEEFNRSANLPLTEFAKLAGKSRQQIYKDIAARRLLALDSGSRGQRLPEWQLDGGARQLTQQVLSEAIDMDAWTIYRALTTPMDALAGKSAVDAALKPRPNLDAIGKKVFDALGLQSKER